MSSIFNSEQHMNIWSWTITSKMCDMLQKAEEKYGERDKKFTFLGIELTSVLNPYIWFYSSDYFIIRINNSCIDDMDNAVFQVSQEIIHCLYPSREEANVLEEGLATLFAIDYCRSSGHTKGQFTDVKYLIASSLVNQLLVINLDIIKKIRVREPSLSRVTKELLLQMNSDIPETLAARLTEKF